MKFIIQNQNEIISEIHGIKQSIKVLKTKEETQRDYENLKYEEMKAKKDALQNNL